MKSIVLFATVLRTILSGDHNEHKENPRTQRIKYKETLASVVLLLLLRQSLGINLSKNKNHPGIKF